MWGLEQYGKARAIRPNKAGERGPLSDGPDANVQDRKRDRKVGKGAGLWRVRE